MVAKINILSELPNISSVKSSKRANLIELFTNNSLGHLLCRMFLERQTSAPAVQLILSLSLIRIVLNQKVISYLI